MEGRIIMKKRRGSLLQRMMAVLFAAVLTAGMVSDVVSAGVPVQEGSAAESLGNEGTESETISTNDTEPASVAEPQSVKMAAAPAPQANNIASGNGWALDADGKLTISSDDGMADWCNNGNRTYASQVKSVAILDTVTSIKARAFNQCSNLTEIAIPEKVESIGTSAFYFCSSLTKITIPAGVKEIEDDTFGFCSGLTEIVIPASVEKIGREAFMGCTSLETVTMQGEPPTLGSDVFGIRRSGNDQRCGFVQNNTQGIRVPEGKAQAYKDAWTDWADYIADGTMTEKYTVTASGGTAPRPLPCRQER